MVMILLLEDDKKFLTILPAQVMREERLGSVTKTARAEEEERLSRLGRLQQEELPGFDLLLPIFTLHLVFTQHFSFSDSS